MPLSLSGTLTDPYGDPRGDATITFRAIATSNQVLEHANAAAITDSSGSYAITVEFGRYNIEVKESGSPSPRIIAKNVLINGDTTAADLNELVVAANGYDDLTPQIVLEFRALRDETQGYRDEAQGFAQSASEDATATAADRQAVADDRAHVDQQRQAVDTTADEVEADRLAAQQARGGAEDAQGASETARDESRAWATGDGVIDNISGTDRFSSRVEADRAASERQSAESAATAAADSAQTALEQANRAESEADRATTYADNAGYVTRQRLAEQSTLNLDFARGKYLVDDGELIETTNASEILSVERASPKWVFGPNGMLREVPPNTIARQWRNGVPQGVLIEEERTNLFLYSDAPATQDISVTSGTVYTVSVIGSGSADLSGAGTGSATSGTPLTFTASTTSLTVTITGSIDYCQVEEGSAASSIIVTEDAPVTRAADNVFRTLGDELNPPSWTLYLEVEKPEGAENSVLSFSIRGNQANSRAPLFIQDERARFEAKDGEGAGVFTLTAPPGSFTRDVPHKLAIAISSGYIAMAFDGAIVNSSTTQFDPLAYTDMFLANNWSGASPNGQITQELNLYPRAFTEQELIDLTS